MLLIVAALARQRISLAGRRDVTGHAMPPYLRLRLSDEIEEGGHRLVALRRVALHHPDGAATDGAVERWVDIVLVRQEGGAPVDLGVALDIAVRRGRVDEGRTTPGGKQLLRAQALAGDLQDAVVEPFLQAHDLRDHLGLVVDEFGAEPIEAVGKRAVGLVVDGAVVLQQAPVEIARQYRAALADALGL